MCTAEVKETPVVAATAVTANGIAEDETLESALLETGVASTVSPITVRASVVLWIYSTLVFFFRRPRRVLTRKRLRARWR